MTPHSDWRGIRDWIVAAFLRVARRQPPRKHQRWLLAAAILLFFAVTVVALLRLPVLEVEWRWLIAAAVLSIAVVGSNAAEYWLAGRWLDVCVRPIEAVRVTVFASAANLAPIPGAVLVRGRELYSRGASAAAIGRALATIGAGWVAMSFLMATLALWVASATALALVALAMAGACAILVPRLRPEESTKRRIVVSCLTVELLAVTAQAARYYAIFRALSFDADWHQVLGLPLAGALASAAGLFPGGLGLRELLAGGISELVALPAAAGAIGSAADRVIDLLVLATFAALLIALPLEKQGGKLGSTPDF